MLLPVVFMYQTLASQVGVGAKQVRKGVTMVADVVDTEETVAPSGLIGSIVGQAKSVDNLVVGTAKGIVSIISPGLANTLVSLDKNFKHLCGDLVKNSVNFGLGILKAPVAK
jgi:hypothetical protein